MDLNLKGVQPSYVGERTLGFNFKVGMTTYTYYYHRDTDTTHCNCSTFETEGNDKQIRDAVKRFDRTNKPKLTPSQKKFFETPKSMDAVYKRLFTGDAFAANNFQNFALTNGLLEWNGNTFKLPENGNT